MSSLLRSVKKRKKSRVLGEVEVLSREEYVAGGMTIVGMLWMANHAAGRWGRRTRPPATGVDARGGVARRGSEGVGG